MGPTITYMRRYSYAAIIGMTQEDEDAANARVIKKQNNEFNDAIGMIDQAIQTKDANYIKANWQGSIAKVWGSLGEQRVADLNRLVNAV